VLAAALQELRQSGAVAAGAFDGPAAAARRMLLGEAQGLPIAAPVGADLDAGHDAAAGRLHHGQGVAVTVRIATDHEVRPVCQHPVR
jgi:hypothetical protein